MNTDPSSYYYAGIGSRETPEACLGAMETVAGFLAKKGATLRSGGADGADSAFEKGCLAAKGKMQIFLPWRGFNNRVGKDYIYPASDDDSYWLEARKIAADHHPVFHSLSKPVQAFHTRNVFQVLGPTLKLASEAVICYTKDGKASGGTGQAIRIANSFKIPVVNLFFPEHCKHVWDLMIGNAE